MTEPIDWTAIDNALFDWVVGALGLSAAQCIWANQDIPQPVTYPYVTLLRTAVAEEGTGDELRTSTDLGQAAGEEIELLTTGPKSMTLTVTCHNDRSDDAFTDPARNATALLTVAHASLGKLSVLEALGAAGIAVIERLPVADTSVAAGGEWLSQASMDVRLRVTSTMTERTGYIDKVRVSSTITGAIDSLNLDDYLIDAS